MILLIKDEHKRSPCPPPSPAALLEEQPQLREDAHGSRPCPAAARRELEMLGEEGMIRDEGTDPTGKAKKSTRRSLSPPDALSRPGQQGDRARGWRRWQRSWIRGLQSPNSKGTRFSFPTRPVSPPSFQGQI